MYMNLELLASGLAEFLKGKFRDIYVDADEIIETTAATIVLKIQAVLKNEELSDFEMVEEIVCIFEDHHLDAGCCHDFG